MGETLLLVDAYSLIYRAFYAIRVLTGPGGEPVNAIFGFTKMLRKLLAEHRPSHAAVVFDLGPPTVRLALLPSYKAQRPPTPPDLERQVPAIRDMIPALGLALIEAEGQEADDLIATLAVRFADAGGDVLIASTDKDFMQLVGPRLRLVRSDGKETKLVDAAAVQARYGVPPEQIVDLLSLTGDAVDNIRGVPGVGEKTAADLLGKYQTLDNLLAHASDIPKPKLRDALLAHTAQLHVNRVLIALRCDLELPLDRESLRVQSPDYPALLALTERFGFKSFRAELEKERTASADLFDGR